jgi:hypothetical protein
VPCRVLLDQVVEAYTGGDVPALISLYDEDALISGAAEPDAILGRDELFIRSDVLQRTHLVGPIDVIPIDQTAGLLRAVARSATDGRFRPATERIWILTFKAGLVYRQRVVDSREEAADLYARYGVELGMDQPTALASVVG